MHDAAKPGPHEPRSTPRVAHGPAAFFAALAGLLAGSAGQLGQVELAGTGTYLSLLGLALTLAMLTCLANRDRGRAAVLAATLAGAALGFGLTGARATWFLQGALDPALEGRDLAITGVVARLPQRSESGLRFVFEPESATLDGQPVHLPRLLQLGWYGAAATGDGGGDSGLGLPPEVRAGDRWLLTARLKAPHGQINPHGFDYELWLWEQGLQAVGTVRTTARHPPPRLLGATWRHPVHRLRQQVRDAVFAQIQDRRQAGVVAALVAGDQNAIDRADWDIFRATGVAHLMSISGLHITMFAWACGLLVGWAWRRSARLCLWMPARHAALGLGLALAASYALFSGWGVPAQRTVLMLATLCVLQLSGRRWPWPFTLLVACAVVVLADPWALLQAGFWLSFVAVGVLFAAAPVAQQTSRSALQHVKAGLREQWVVTLALAPMSLLLFQQVSLVGLVANLLAIPWVTLVVTPLAMLGVLLPWAWDLSAWALQGLAWYLQGLALVPHATWSNAAAPLWAGWAAVSGGVLVVLRVPWPLRLLGLGWMLPLLLWQAPRPAPGEFEVVAADVGQGNALLVRTAGHTLVYDSGPRYSVEADAGQRVLVPLLRAWDERVDLLLLSHRDSDHTGGAKAVLDMQTGAALLSSLESGHELHQDRASTRCIDHRDGGQAWDWDGVRFEVVHPRASDYQDGARPNSLSCVLRISNGRQAALLAGDIERAQELALVERAQQGDGPSAIRADLLLVPHHGSKTSSSPALLQAVLPRLAMVQAGYRNRFGHPAPEVMLRYRELGITVVDSPRCGAATWRSIEPAAIACQRQRVLRYWHHRLP